MTQIDLDKAREYLLKLVPQAGEILKKYFISGQFTSKSKGGVDVLTQADEEVDKFLLENIKKQYPKSSILTEETAPKDYSSFSKTDNLWVIDPLDGTVNFSRGNPHFAVSVGLVDYGIPKLGVVFSPVYNNLYWAQKDISGVFLNGKAIKVSIISDLKEAVVLLDWGWNLKTRVETVKWLGNIVTKVRQLKTMGSAVTDLASLAGGKIDAYIHSGLKPWDTAASVLFIEKAGGKITTLKGEKWNIFIPDMLATNGILHKEILDLIS